MSAPMTPGQEPAESEFSHGPGMVPNKARSVAGRIPGPEAPGRREMVQQLWAERRTDSTDSGSTADYGVLGNPDHFGAQPMLTKESEVLPATPYRVDPLAPGGVPGTLPKTGVERQP